MHDDVFVNVVTTMLAHKRTCNLAANVCMCVVYARFLTNKAGGWQGERINGGDCASHGTGDANAVIRGTYLVSHTHRT